MRKSYLIVKTTTNNNTTKTEALIAFECPIKAKECRDLLSQKSEAVLKEILSTVTVFYEVKEVTLIEGLQNAHQ
jgi:hypothetical protein